MKCECSLTNKHEIVGLCDIQKFNEKINLFVDESWTQVSISDNLILSGDKPSIKTITKTFIDVKITSTKIVNTPKSQDSNIEGMSLTGKLLLVAGEITQRVLYVSNNSNLEKINSFKIKTPFTTYIVIDEDVEINEDRYCVFPCIEYASLRPINNKSLSQNVTMFLFARRIPKPFNNDIIFKNENDQELAKIKFDSNTNMLEVSFIQANTNDNKVLKFELYKRDGATLRKVGTINTNSNAQQFTEELNKQRFYFYDVINISYEDKPNNVLIKNFPNMGDDYNPKIDRNEAFVITRNGLVPYALPNKIILNDDANRPIIELSFSKFGNKVRVVSTGNTTPNRMPTQDYFRVNLNNQKPKQTFIGIIKRNQDGSVFKNRLDEKAYSIGDIIDIFCEEPNKVEITNYPNKDNTYNLKQKTERFRITAKGLEKINIPEYPNEIVLKNNTSQELARVKFNVSTSILEVTSTGNMASRNDDFTVQLFKASSREDFTGTISPNTDATLFKTQLNGKAFSFGDVIQITADPPNQGEIINYPTQGNVYNLTEDTERFRITEMGLVKIEVIARYANEIKLKNENNEELATIQFDPTTNILIVEPHPTPGRVNDGTPIKVELYREDGKTLTASGEIEGNANASKLKEYLEGAFFKYGDVINLIYGSKPNKVEIDDVPTVGNPYTPKLDNNEAFVITRNGLELYALKHKIVSANGNRDIAEVYFSKLNNKIKVFSTGNNAPSKQGGSLYADYFKVIFFRDNQNSLIGTIPYSQDGSSFKQALELSPYSIGDTLMTISADQLKTRLEDVITGVITINNNNIIRYEITEKGLIEMSAIYLNDIIFKNDSNQEIAMVRFELSTQKLFVTKTNNIIQGSGRPVLQFRLYSPDRILKANGVIVEKALAVSFVDDLNEKSFNFGDIIIIGYGTHPRRVNIDNLPNIGDIYIPIFAVSEAFIVKQTGLVRYTLQNSIILFNQNNDIIVNISFQAFPRTLKIISTGKLAPNVSSGADYFKVKLKKSNSTGEFIGIIKGNNNGTLFKQSLDNKAYDVGDIIEIFCEEPNKVTIRNFPNIGQDYKSTQKKESFRITDNKLEK